MRGRRLRLPSSSDEDDAGADVQVPPNPNPPLVISDDDFVDVPDELSDPSPPAPPPPPPAPTPTPIPTPTADRHESRGGDAMEADYPAVRPIGEFMDRLGLRLRPEWLASCAAGLVSSGSGFERLDVAGKAKMCFEQFLVADMNHCGAGVLPPGVHAMHKAELEGPFVLQVDEVINICSSLRERYHDAPAGMKRCLKLSLTDGIQRVFGMEYRSIRELEVFAPAGFKVVIRNVQIRRGLLILVPEVLEVLGGMVESLDAARKRLVDEVNKPPRGKRKQFVLPLSRRASLAAWSSDTSNSSAQANNSMSRPNNPQVTAQAATMATTTTASGETFIEEFDHRYTRVSVIEESSGQHNVQIISEELGAPHTRRSITAEQASATSRPDMGPSTFGTIMDEDDNRSLDAVNAASEVEHPLILSGEKEIPFTYLASLLANWAIQKDSTPFIRGKIKCCLTGVKMFQYQRRSTYELRVFVDDGSLISEVLIDHHVVQKGIGHSPEEVSAARSSSDEKIAADMRETMMKFQLFLARFEGTMLVEINARSPVPTALEMDQGCSTSDAWLLHRRLKKFTARHESQHTNFRPINLSP